MKQISKKLSMLRRWARMLTRKSSVAVEQGLGKAYSLTEIKGYYNDMTGKVTPNTQVDEDGVPVNTIADGSRAYAWITIFQYALGCYDLYLLQSDPAMRDNFLFLAQKILHAQDSRGGWDCRASIGSKRGGTSCMGQGQACSILLRAHALTGEQAYVRAAEKAVAFMLLPTDDQGAAVYEDGGLYLEKYPPENGRHSSVLNGWAYALFGLYDYVLVTRDAGIRDKMQASMRTLTNTLPLYDAGFWSNYDINGTIASPAYHQAHIALLEALAELSGMNVFAEYAQRFRAYRSHPLYTLRAVFQKLRQKLHEDTDALLIR